MPLSFNQAVAFSMSALHSTRAFLQSIIGASVAVRKSFTIAAVTSMIILPLFRNLLPQKRQHLQEQSLLQILVESHLFRRFLMLYLRLSLLSFHDRKVE